MPAPGVEEVFPSISIRELLDECARVAQEKGWNDETNYSPRSFGDIIALIHSELSEALEEFRNGHQTDEIYFNEDIPSKPEGVPVELADVLIRIFHYCARHDVPLEHALLIKMEYNETRPMRHGGKTI